MNVSFRRALSWVWVVLWVLVVYLTLPYAPVWRKWLVDRFSESFFPNFVASVLCIISIFTIIYLISRKARAYQYVIFILTGAGYWYSLSKIEIAVEQVHFLEYGLLAILIVNAFRFNRKDVSQFYKTMILLTLIGVVDEYIQGILVSRVGELHDVNLNILAGALALVWYRYCMNVTLEEKSEWFTAVKFSLPIAGLIILIIGFFNIRISEFGYYIEDDEIGAFYSRMTAEQLLNNPPEVEKFRSTVLPRLFIDHYADILREVETPVHSEILVHIFRRFKRLKDNQDYAVSYRENQILEKYFLPFIENTDYQWHPGKKDKVFQAAEQDLDTYYISPVSEHLIVSFSEKTMWSVIVILEIIFFTLFFKLKL